MIENSISTLTLKSSRCDDEPHTFEEAVRKTGFGKYNITLILLAVCGIFTPMFETTTMSYVFAGAHCDLHLTLQDKGYLNSVTYAGMISSSFVWGFLLDIFGRRKLMIYGYFLDAFFIFLSALSQNFTMLILCKFFGGFIINGPFAAMTAYLSEFHSSQYRSRIQLINGMLTSFAQVVLPLLAWGILPLDVEVSLFAGAMKLHSWHLFLFACAMFPFVSGIIFFFLPESPKFLMTLGENEKALEVLQRVYSWNTGNPPEAYPVKELVQEKIIEIDMDGKKHSQTKMEAIKDGLNNLKPLFQPPLLNKFVLLTLIITCCLTSLNMFRLWSPQLFQAVEDYRLFHNGSTTDLCTMMEFLKPQTTVDGPCVVNANKPMAYVNSMISSTFPILLYIGVTSVVLFLGKKKVIIFLTSTSAAMGFALYFSHGSLATTAISSCFFSAGNISGNVILAVIVDVFPTTLRAFTLSLVMAIGRIGIMVGNLIFPVLLESGCAAPFFVLGGIYALAGLLGFLLPNTENKPLQ